MNLRSIIKVSILIVVLIIIMLISLLILNNKENKDSFNVNTENKTENIIKDEEDRNGTLNELYAHNSNVNAEETNYKLSYITSNYNYFTIKSINEKYIGYIAYKNREALKAILAPDYILKYNVTDNNIFESIKFPELASTKQYFVTTITDILKTNLKEQKELYIVSSKSRIAGTDTVINNKIIVEIDNNNKTYNIYPYQYLKDRGYDKLNVGNAINFSDNEVNNREYNIITYETADDKDLINEYYNQLKEFLIYYKEDAYNILDKNYAQKRFENKKEFYEYVSDNYRLIFLGKIDKYKVETNGNNKDYICTDNNNNYYIFRQNGSITNYTVLLDNYTILSKEYLDNYNSLDGLSKAKNQLISFIKKVNTKDYKAIYSNLDSTFKNNNFNTVDKLREYVKESFYELNSIEIIDYNETSDYFVFNCKITNMENTNESKNLTVIINILEGTNYTMSFSFN